MHDHDHIGLAIHKRVTHQDVNKLHFTFTEYTLVTKDEIQLGETTCRELSSFLSSAPYEIQSY